jgi:hypothetical protein
MGKLEGENRRVSWKEIVGANIGRTESQGVRGGKKQKAKQSNILL